MCCSLLIGLVTPLVSPQYQHLSGTRQPQAGHNLHEINTEACTDTIGAGEGATSSFIIWAAYFEQGTESCIWRGPALMSFIKLKYHWTMLHLHLPQNYFTYQAQL